MTSELLIRCPAYPDRVKLVRHALASFLRVFELESAQLSDVVTAVGEALINVVEHAYDGRSAPSDLQLSAHLLGQTLSVEVADQGRFVLRAARPGRGFGLRIVQAIATDVSIDHAEGTRVRMTFHVSG